MPSPHTLHDSSTHNQVSAPDITSASASYTIRMTYMHHHPSNAVCISESLRAPSPPSPQPSYKSSSSSELGAAGAAKCLTMTGARRTMSPTAGPGPSVSPPCLVTLARRVMACGGQQEVSGGAGGHAAAAGLPSVRHLHAHGSHACTGIKQHAGQHDWATPACVLTHAATQARLHSTLRPAPVHVSVQHHQCISEQQASRPAAAPHLLRHGLDPAGVGGACAAGHARAPHSRLRLGGRGQAGAPGAAGQRVVLCMAGGAPASTAWGRQLLGRGALVWLLCTAQPQDLG